jgi:hypothetical protein
MTKTTKTAAPIKAECMNGCIRQHTELWICWSPKRGGTERLLCTTCAAEYQIKIDPGCVMSGEDHPWITQLPAEMVHDGYVVA